MNFQRIRPFVYLFVAAAFAYLPVSFMLYALKNDIVNVEFPIKYFISQCIHNGVSPFWFNTWGMGFPLESVITWNVYSPLGLLFCALFRYSLYVQHVEFIFYITLGGCSMYYFLRRYFIQDRSLGLILSMCYMLSGFAVGSSQWLTYIVAGSLLPLVICCFFDVLFFPSIKSALSFSLVFFCMFTGSYVAYTIVTCYILLGLFILFIISKRKKRAYIRPSLVYLLATAGMVLAFCALPTYISWQVLQYMKRGHPISDPSLFNSNEVYPIGLTTLLFPIASVKMHPWQSEGAMMDLYMGLFPLLLLPLYIRRVFRDGIALILLTAAIFFTMSAMGPFTPVRQWMNILPGFAYFRNPGLLRLFAIFSFILFTARGLQGYDANLFLKDRIRRRTLLIASCALLTLYGIYVVAHLSSFDILRGLSLSSLKNFIQGVSQTDAFFISSIVEGSLLIVTIVFLFLKSRRLFFTVLAFDLIINTLLCTPFFTVSSHSVAYVNKMFEGPKGFPVQTETLLQVPTSYSSGGAIWYNLNVYQKKVSALPSYIYPLALTNYVSTESADSNLFNHLLIYSDSAEVHIQRQLPSEVTAEVHMDKPVTVHFLQNYYPGWHAYLNGKPIELSQDERVGMKVNIRESGLVGFRYERSSLLFWSAVLVGFWVVGMGVYVAISRKVSKGKKDAKEKTS